MAASLDSFLVALCQRMGWEPTTWRIGVLKTMAQVEGNVDKLGQMWNPLSTTHPAGKSGNWNSVGVGIYPNLAAGVEATARTLEEPQYAGLVATMKAQSPQPGVEQGLAIWGWTNGQGGLSSAGQQILNVMGGAAPQGGDMVTQQQTTPPEDITQDVIAWLNTIYGVDSETNFGGGYYFAKDMEGTTAFYRKNVLGETGAAEAPTWSEQQGAAQGWAGVGISQGNLAVSQQSLELQVQKWAQEAQNEAATLGLAVAAQNFANKINQATEARARAQFAVDYSQIQAPEGMTTLPYTGAESPASTYAKQMGLDYDAGPGFPLPQANLPSDPWALLQQAGTTIPPGPEVQATAPQLPVTPPTTGTMNPSGINTGLPGQLAVPLAQNLGMTTQGPLATPSPMTPSADMTAGAGMQPQTPPQPLMAGMPSEMLPYGSMGTSGVIPQWQAAFLETMKKLRGQMPGW